MNSVLETTFLLVNIAIIMGFLVFVAYSKHLHIFLAPINVATSRRPRALGALASTPDMSMEDVGDDDEVVFGAGRIEDFSWKQLLDMATCTECGRCQSQCPAWNTGKPLSPKLLIMDLRDNMFANADRIMQKNRAAGVEVEGLVGEGLVIDPDVLWSCTTCGACVEQCPVDIEHIDTIIDMRRYQVLMESEFPSEAGLMLRNVENQGDPWGLGGAKRTDWIESLDFEVPVITGTIPDDVEYLYWVGCAGALDERARKGAQATARMLHRAGVSFGILGPKESCTGDPVRRLGNEYLYQEQAMKNIETLNDAGVKKVIATCPHCFNSLANEYPALGGNFEVIHHSQLLDHLVQAGRLTPGGGYAGSVTYHDPCYLGRHNRVFDEPRSVIDAIPGAKQIEMKRCREKGFCCGAGGARMWLEENIGTRVNMDRTDEAIGTGADVVSTACPYCMIMLDDAVRANAKEDDVRVLDLSQLLEESMGEPVAVGARRAGGRRADAVRGDRRPRSEPSGPRRPGAASASVEGLGVGLAQPGGQRREHLAGDGGHRLEQTVELALGHDQHVHVRLRDDRGRAGAAVEQGELAEVAAGPEGGHLLAVAGHLGRAVDDDEELLADVALLDQDLAGRHRHGVEGGPDLAQLRAGAARRTARSP